MHVQAEVVLPVEARTAFQELVRWEEQPSWMVDAARVEVVGDQREGPGVRLRVRTRVLGLLRLTDAMEVIAWDPPRRIEIQHRGLVRGRGSWRLEPLGPGATRFAWTEDLSLPVPVIGALLLLPYRPVMRLLMQRSLRALRRRLEGRSPEGDADRDAG